MKVKVGQWVRTDNGIIEKPIFDFDFESLSELVIAVADTPQELIQVGDLVFRDSVCILVHTKKNGVLGSNDWIYYDIEEITKILTPNSNGGYDLQWEENNEKA